jgi:hypothetical protein
VALAADQRVAILAEDGQTLSLERTGCPNKITVPFPGKAEIKMYFPGIPGSRGIGFASLTVRKDKTTKKCKILYITSRCPYRAFGRHLRVQ